MVVEGFNPQLSAACAHPHHSHHPHRSAAATPVRPDKLLTVAASLLLGGAVLYRLVPHLGGVVCPVRLITGIPCPLCGMTTSVTATVRGDLAEAGAANPAGILLVIAAIALLVWPRARSLRPPPALLALLVTSMWVFELFRFDVL